MSTETKHPQTLVQDQIEAMNRVGVAIPDAAHKWIISTYWLSTRAEYLTAVKQLLELDINYAGPKWQQEAVTATQGK